MRNTLTVLSLVMLFISCKQNRIIERPIVFDKERKALTIAYLKDHYGLIQSEPIIDPKMVVIHWTVIPTLGKSYNAFKDAKLPSFRSDIAAVSTLNVSSQFLVDRNGEIYRLMPENFMARHVIGLNHCAIGIENVGGTDELPLTPAQLESNIWIVKYLKEKYGIEYLIGHYEYTYFEGHELWLERDDGYRTEKTDPGKKFLADIRLAVKDLGFKKNPVKVEVQIDGLINN